MSVKVLREAINLLNKQSKLQKISWISHAAYLLEVNCIPAGAIKYANFSRPVRWFAFPAVLTRAGFVLRSLPFYLSPRLFSTWGSSIYTPRSQHTWHLKPIILHSEQSEGDASSFLPKLWFILQTYLHFRWHAIVFKFVLIVGDMNILNLHWSPIEIEQLSYTASVVIDEMTTTTFNDNNSSIS